MRAEMIKICEMGSDGEVRIKNSMLPAWFIERMGSDVWYFALLTVTGHTIFISRIDSISVDGKWIDVILLDPEEYQVQKGYDPKMSIFCCAGDRDRASVQVSTIVCAYEVAST